MGANCKRNNKNHFSIDFVIGRKINDLKLFEMKTNILRNCSFNIEEGTSVYRSFSSGDHSNPKWFCVFFLSNEMMEWTLCLILFMGFVILMSEYLIRMVDVQCSVFSVQLINVSVLHFLCASILIWFEAYFDYGNLRFQNDQIWAHQTNKNNAFKNLESKPTPTTATATFLH